MRKEKNKDKINFFKKIYYSIFKIKKYDELAKDGLWKGIKYIMDLLIILSVVYAIIIVIQTKKSVNNLKNYLKDNLPEMVYEDNMLTTASEERKILDNELVKINFGGQIVIDTVTEYNELIDEYKKTGEPSIILTKDKFTTISENGAINEAQYNKIIEKYLNKEVKRIDKEELLYFFDNYSYQYYFFSYMLAYVIAHSIVTFVYCLIIATLAFSFCKIKKITIKYLEVYTMAIYASTMSIIAYFAVNFMPYIVAIITRISFAIIPVVLLGMAIYVNKWITPDMVGKKK